MQKQVLEPVHDHLLHAQLQTFIAPVSPIWISNSELLALCMQTQGPMTTDCPLQLRSDLLPPKCQTKSLHPSAKATRQQQLPSFSKPPLLLGLLLGAGSTSNCRFLLPGTGRSSAVSSVEQALFVFFLPPIAARSGSSRTSSSCQHLSLLMHPTVA